MAALACGAMGEQGIRRLAPVGEWLAMRWPIVVAPLMAATAVALMTYGIMQLT